MKKRINQLTSSPLKYGLMGLLLLVLLTQSAFVPMFFDRETVATDDIPPGRFRTTVGCKMGHESPYGSYGSYDLYVYYVGNKKYDYHGPNMAFTPKGEKYLLRYDTLYPTGEGEHSNLIIEHPVFLPGEVTRYTVGTLVKAPKNYATFDYIYTVSGKKHYRTQDMDDPVKNHPEMVKEAEFFVEYWVKNPERAILHINMPKKDGTPFPASPDIQVLRPVWDSTPVVLPNPQLIKSQPGWQ